MKKMSKNNNSAQLSRHCLRHAPYMPLTCLRQRSTQLLHFVAVMIFLFLGGWNTQAWAWDGTYTVTAKSRPTAGGYVSNNNNFSGHSTEITATGTCSAKWNKSATAQATVYALAASGYTFTGWSTKEDGSNIVSRNSSYTSTSESMNTLSRSKSATFYAIFTPTYTIVFNGNGNTSGSMSDLSMVYGTAQSLTNNAFQKQYTITYNTDGGSCTTSSSTVTYTFSGWEDRNSIVFNGTTYAYTTFDAPYYANTYGDLYAAFGYNKYNLIQHYVNYGKGEGRSCKGATPGLYPNQASVNNLTTTAGATVTLYAHWDCVNPSVTLPSATKSGKVLEGWYNGSTKVGEAGDTYTPTASVTLKAKWIDKYTPEITGANTDLSVGEQQANAFTFTHTSNPTPHITVTSISSVNNGDGKVIEYDAVNNKIIAHNAGTATIYFTQDETSTIKSGTSATYTYTVTKLTTSFSGSAYNLMVDGTQTADYSYTNTSAAQPTASSSDDFYYTIDEVSFTNEELNKGTDLITFNPSDKLITACNAGTAKITLHQKETYKYTGAEESFDVSVSKYTPSFTWNSAGKIYYYQSTIPSIFSTTGPNAYTIVSDNEPSAKVVDNTLHIYNVEETANITVTQEENYLWAGKTATYVVTPFELDNHVKFTITSSNYDTPFKYGSEGEFAWDGGIKLGDGGGGFNWDDKYYDIVFSGIPDKLSFDYEKQASGATGVEWWVKESSDGSNWVDSKWGKQTSGSGSATNIQLLPTTRYLRLCYSGNFGGYYKNINVTELNQFSATPAIVNFGTKGVNFGTQEETVTFNHANAGRVTTMEIVGDDAAYFSIERSSIPGTGRDLYATANIVVSFDNKKGPAGHEPSYTAVLHIEDNAGHDLNITLTGTRDGKTEPEFSFNANHLPYFVGTNIANVASSTNTDYTNCPLTITTSDASIAEVIDGTLHIYNKKEEVTITISQGENKDFSAGSATFTFTPRERPERTVPMQLVKSIYNEGTVEAGNKCAWEDSDDGRIRVGNDNVVVDDWIWYNSEKNFTIAFDGQPGRLSFEYKNTGWVVTSDPSGHHTYQVQESSDGASWNTVWYTDATTTDWTSVKEVTLSPSTRYLRFSFSGNYWGYFRNINISELVGYKYLRAESDGRYLSRGAKWGTQAIVDDFGMACRISNYTNDNTNFYTRFLFVDNQQYLYEADNHEMYTDDGTAANNYNLWKQNVIDGTILTFQSGNEYPGDSRKGQYVTLNGDALALTADAAAATRWQMEDYTEHKAYIDAMLDREAAAAAAKDFGSSVNTLEKVRTEIAVNEFETTVIDIPALALGEQSGEYRSGIDGTNAVYDNTISGLVPGFYRLTVKAFYRISSADIAWNCHDAGMESVLAYIYANDVEYPIQSLYKSYHVSPLEPSDELRGGHYYSNDLTSAGEAFGDEKRYLNDVYVYVPADAGLTTGTLRYGIKNPSYVPGAWLAYKNITLTRIARKEYIFEGTIESEKENWKTDGNWNRESVPTENHAVIIRSDVLIEEEVAAYSMAIENNAIVTVAPTGGLTIGAGGVKNATKDNLILKASISGATKGQTGFLRISPNCTQPMPEATIELYTIGYYNMNVGNHQDVGTWQYVGSPMVGGTAAKNVFTLSMIYNWNETTGEWKNNRRNLVLQPFTGYATSQYNPEGRLVTNTGQLVDNGVVVIPLTYTESSAVPGCNVLANSFAAPIDISKLEASDFSEGVDATIHLFNTGSKQDIAAASESSSFDAPGQYMSIPVINVKALKSAFADYPSLIPSMQGFYVNTNKAGTITLDYEKLVWNTKLSASPNVPLRAPKGTNEEEEQTISAALKITITADSLIDNLFLLESESYNASYENGYDARKKMSCAFNIFAIEDNDQLAVDATNSLIGTRVGVRTGDETAYTFVFSHLQTEDGLALYDAETDQTIDINEGTEYTFFAEPNVMVNDRFRIIERAEIPAITTGVDNTESNVKVHKFIKDDQLFILKNGVLYNAAGIRVR